MLAKYSYDTMKRRPFFSPTKNIFDSMLSDLFEPMHQEPWTFTTVYSGAPITGQSAGTSLQHQSTWTDKGAILTIDIPGVQASDLDVTVDEHNLTVKYERNGVKHQNSFILSSQVDPKPTKATLENGVLTLEFNKIELQSEKVHKVTIESK